MWASVLVTFHCHEKGIQPWHEAGPLNHLGDVVHPEWWGAGCGVQGSGLRVEDLEFRFWGLSFQCLVFLVKGVGSRWMFAGS